jgi:hypothetical protein
VKAGNAIQYKLENTDHTDQSGPLASVECIRLADDELWNLAIMGCRWMQNIGIQRFSIGSYYISSRMQRPSHCGENHRGQSPKHVLVNWDHPSPITYQSHVPSVCNAAHSDHS